MALNNTPKVAILTSQFFQLDGKRCLFGGGERYLIDLCKMLKKFGYYVEIFQASSTGIWEKIYEDIKINGISDPGVKKDFYIRLNKVFYNIASNFDYHIYFNLDVIYPNVFSNSICISHGIWWDSTERKWWRTQEWYNYLFKGLSSMNLLISVDTNTINWLNSVKPDLLCRTTYIPNYVDLNLFKQDNNKSKDYIKILYPRRLCKARGWDICRELALELTKEYEDIIFSFVGRGSNDITEKYMKNLAKRKCQIEYTWYETNDMYKAYSKTDIVLIPSLYSEGTSFSLLEAMACGKAVIAGLVGGLTDLILQGFNGYLIKVDKENLKNIILYLKNNPEKRIRLGKNARMVSEAFSKEIWEERWKKLIVEFFK